MRVRERRLRKRCRRLLRDLDVQPPLDVPNLVQRIGESRGRSIELYSYPIRVPGPLGLWFGPEEGDPHGVDAIFYQQETSKPHQDHIIVHELGHILADHPSDESDRDAAVTEIHQNPPGEGFDQPPRARRRTCYDSHYEKEAELVATIILEWASVLEQRSRMIEPPESPAHRMSHALNHHQGWL